MAGNVIVNDRMIDKPGTPVDINSNIKTKQNSPLYVSRGGAGIKNFRGLI